jgi:hypothetical protein
VSRPGSEIVSVTLADNVVNNGPEIFWKSMPAEVDGAEIDRCHRSFRTR